MRYKMPAIYAALVTMATAGNAFAHADLKSSVPEKDATVKTAPSEISIEFTE